MAGRGGKRAGAGAPKGSKKRWKQGQVAEQFGGDMLKLAREYLKSKDPEVQMWAWEKLLPYTFMKMPQEQVISDPDGNAIQLTLVEKKS